MTLTILTTIRLGILYLFLTKSQKKDRLFAYVARNAYICNRNRNKETKMMMKRLYLWIPCVILTLWGVMASLTSCTYIDNPAPVVIDDKPFDLDKYIDTSVRPGDDFFHYACGKWLDDESLASLKTMADQQMIYCRDHAILDSSDPVMTAIRQLVAEAETDSSADMKLLQSRLDMLSAITTQAELEAAFAQLHQWGYKPLLRQLCHAVDGVFAPVLEAAKVSPFTHDEMHNHDLEGLSVNVQYVCSLLSDMGFSDERVEEIYQHAMVIEEQEMDIFEGVDDEMFLFKPTKSICTRGTESSSLEQICQLIGISDLADEIVIYGYHRTIMGQLIDMLLSGTDESIATMRDYLIYYVMGQDSSFIPQLTPWLWDYWRKYYAIQTYPYHLYRVETEVEGKENIQKEKCSEMMEDIRQVLIDHIDKLDWMTEATKQEAKKKARAMKFFVGYPDQWNEAFIPKIEGTTLLEAVCSLRRQAEGVIRQQVGLDARTHGWDHLCSQLLFTQKSALYTWTANMLFVPPYYLIPPMFDIEQSEAMLYANATSFAHEVSHGFDSGGSNYDENGVWRDWWAAEDRAVFKQKQQQMIALWNQLEAYPGQPADGEKTLNENMADLGGATLAYDAYKRRLKKQGYSGEQFDQQLRKFWVSYAHEAALPDDRYLELLKWHYLYDDHSVGQNRVNGIVRLFDDWYRLFDVKPTDKLYLTPEDRVRIW